jgi:hypothetical protein
VRVEAGPPFGFHRLIKKLQGDGVEAEGFVCPRADREVPAIHSRKERLFFVERALPETVKTRYKNVLVSTAFARCPTYSLYPMRYTFYKVGNLLNQ